MTASHDVVVDTANRVISATRVFDAPRERVFDCWFDPAHITNWWGPRGFTTTTHEMDARPGGVWRFTMHGPDGRDYPNRVVYREIVRPERLVYRHTGEGDDDPLGFEVTITFTGKDGKTEVGFRMVFDTEALCEEAAKFGAVEGLRDTLSRLATQLEKKPPGAVDSGRDRSS